MLIKPPDYSIEVYCPVCLKKTKGGMSYGKPVIYGDHKDCKRIAGEIQSIDKFCKKIGLNLIDVIHRLYTNT